MLKEKLIKYCEDNTRIYNINSDEINQELDKLYPELNNGTDKTSIRKARKAKATLVYCDIESPPVCGCGSQLEHYKSRDQSPFGSFREFCSISCMTKDKSVNLKRKKTNIERFGVDSFAKIQVFEKKTEEVKKIAKEKALITYQNKYGVDHFSKTQEYLDKRESTVMEKYGVKNALELVNPDNKTPWFTTEEGKEYLKTKKPLSDEQRIIKRIYNMKKSGSIKDQELIDIIGKVDSKRFKEYIENIVKDIIEPDRFKIAVKIGILVRWLNSLFREHGMADMYISANYKGVSSGEREVKSFIEDLGIKVSNKNRGILESKNELDIVIEDYKLAIEYNGVIWHSEGRTGRDKDYHIKKTNQSEDKGYKLLQIYDVEWNNPIKKEIWKSIIKENLNLNRSIKDYKFIIKEISLKDIKSFFNKNHIHGYSKASKHYGLIVNNKIMSCMSIQEKNSIYYIKRFTDIINYNIDNSFDLFIKHISIKNLIYYKDRRFSSILDNTEKYKYDILEPNWKGYYVKEYILKNKEYFTNKTLNKNIKYNKKLSIFDNMLANGYDRIWDSGNIKYYIT